MFVSLKKLLSTFTEEWWVQFGSTQKTSFGKSEFLQAYSTVKEQKNMFRLGVQKCKKIIYDCIPPDPEIFRGEGIEQLFKILHKVQEGRNFTEDELRMEE